MPHFPPPPELPQPVARFHRVPPAIFPTVLGLLGLVAAWNRTVGVFGFPAAVVDVASGMVTLLFFACLIAYLAKVSLRVGALIDDLRTLPGRTGLAAACMGLMVEAALFSDRVEVFSLALLIAGASGLFFIAAYVLVHRLSGTDAAGPPTPAMHLVFVGFILFPGAAIPLQFSLPVTPYLIWYCVIAALFITLITARPLVSGNMPPPLRPLQAIQLAPPAFIATGASATGQTELATLGLAWAVVVAALLLVRARWLTQGGFSGFWSAFTFPVAGFAGALLAVHTGQGWEALRIAGGGVLIATTLYIPVIAWIILKMWASGTLAAKTNASIA